MTGTVEDERLAFDMLAHLSRQRAWSIETFGPGPRAKGVIDHIRKECHEVESDPTDLKEWIDIAILALDGAWRAGYSPKQIVAQLVATQTRNEGRKWPDWRTMSPDKAIEHDRSGEAPSRPVEDGELVPVAWVSAYHVGYMSNPQASGAETTLWSTPLPDGSRVPLYDHATVAAISTRLQEAEKALEEAEAFNAEHGDGADTLHHGNAILDFFRRSTLKGEA